MKRMFLLCGLGVWMMLSGCTAQRAASSTAAETADTAAAETTVSTAETAAVSAAETTVFSSAFDDGAAFSDAAEWKPAYAEVVRASGAELFSLRDVDSDGIPELVLHMEAAQYHANSAVTLYTYYNDGAVLLGENLAFDGSSRFDYIPDTGEIVTGYFGMGYGTYEVFRITDGTLESLHKLVINSDQYEYSVDGERVTEEAYDAVWRPYWENKVSESGEYENTEESIQKVLT